MKKSQNKKKEEHAKENLDQDRCIAKELELRAEQLKSEPFFEPFSKNDSKVEQQNETEKVPPSGQSLFAATQKSDEQEATPARERKKNGSGTKSVTNSLPDESCLKRTNEEEPSESDLEENNDSCAV